MSCCLPLLFTGLRAKHETEIPGSALDVKLGQVLDVLSEPRFDPGRLGLISSLIERDENSLLGFESEATDLFCIVEGGVKR